MSTARCRLPTAYCLLPTACTSHIVIDSPLLGDDWLERHTYQANGKSFGDNAAVADFWYDAVHRRIMSRSAAFHEVDDPADVRLGRAPGTYPNQPDFTKTHAEGTTVGQVGFESWTHNGFGAYFAAVQGTIRDVATGYLDLATVTGKTGRTRTGSSFEADDLIRRVRLHPSGTLEVGFEKDPASRPAPLLLVRGDERLEGARASTKRCTWLAPWTWGRSL
ncbi:MAG TPA: hypothetical protein VGQ10_03190 [Vicinamibacterales bacterium]|nr:hypothetical protein [Vicinamibacterales bacterium]